MTLASNSADQARLSAESGIKLPKINSGMNRIAPKILTSDKMADAKKDKKQAADDAEIINKAKKRFNQVIGFESDNRKNGLDDLKFLNGSQWDEADAKSRNTEGRPCLTENRLPTYANQITNDQRQNRPSIVISPMGDKASKKDAKILRGMIRAIERDSSADVAYDTGFQSAVHNGWGYWRVLTEYETEESFNKVLTVSPVSNPMNVYLDPNRTPFKLDAQWGFISEMIPIDEFKEEYPDSQMTSWDEFGTGDGKSEWMTDKEIRVAEYYYFETESRERIMLDNGHEGWEDELDESIKAKISSGRIEELSRRTVNTKKLKWCKLTAIEILDLKDCDGQYIPIIECYGTTLNINGKVTKKGIVRDAKSPQKMLNYYLTLEAENVALQPKAPWVMEEGQIEGHEDKWQSANRKSYSYLLYKGTNIAGKPAPPPQRQPFVGPPAAILAAKQGQTEALKAVTGVRFDATMSERMQDESGRAIRELNKNSNLGAYHYIDNFGRALRNTGILLCDLIPHVYDTQRIVAILDDSGSEDRVMINPNISTAHAEVMGKTPEDEQPQKIKMFNPKIGRYQVTVTIGPSYATKRVEASESQIEFMRAVPQIAPIIADLVAKNSDWEGAEQLAERIAKSLPANLLTPTMENMSPQVQALVQGMQGQVQQMTQQIQMMTKELSDRQKDRDVALEGIHKTFEAKVLALAEKMEELQVKKEAQFQGTIGRQLAEVSKAIKEFEQNQAVNVPLDRNASPSPVAVQPESLPAGSPGKSMR